MNTLKILIITFLLYPAILFGQTPESSLAGIIPFRQNKESIVLNIKLNDQDRPLSFLLDTGADGIAIMKSLADSLGLVVNHINNANVVGGRMQVEISQNNTVHLSDSLSLRGQNIAIFKEIKEEYDGIIGLNLMRHYISEIDFDKKLIYLYSLGQYKPAKNSITIPIKSFGSLILVPSSVNLTGKKTIDGNFIMDTGADYHLILFSRFVRKNRLLLSGFKPEGEASTISMGVVTPVFYGKTDEFKIGEKIIENNMSVTLQASKGDDNIQGDWPDGSIGIGFFSKYNFTIDLFNKEIHLKPRK